MPRIGFNAAASRDKFYGGGNCPQSQNDDLGPGTYNTSLPPSDHALRPSYAPFNTSALRHDPSKGQTVPGPGTYRSENCYPQSNTEAGRVSFRSTVQRFKPPPKSTTPGPGAYNNHNLDRYAQPVLRSQPQFESKGPLDPRLQWVRVPSAPSIPAANQSYGYEEGDHGALVLQQPVWRGYTGVGKDTVSPLDYQPRIEFTRPKLSKVLNFSKYSGRDHLKNNRVKTPPVYGEAYEDPEVDTVVKKPGDSKRKSAAFCSKTKRGVTVGAKEKELMPGPGSYSLPGSLKVASTPAPGKQNFGTATRRFDEGPRRGSRRSTSVPGPGSYRIPHSDFEYDRRREILQKMVRNPNSPAIGFVSTSQRFEDRHEEEIRAAPGSYEMPTMAREVQKKMKASSRVAVFGTTTKRFLHRVEDDEEGGGGSAGREKRMGGNSVIRKDIPGLQSRNAHTSPVLGNLGRLAGGGWTMGRIKGRDYERESAAFASETKRNQMHVEPGPPPGAYDTLSHLRSNQCGVSMNRGSNRFEGEVNDLDKSRGPGTYNLPTSFGAPRITNRKGVMVSETKRFGPDLNRFASEVPGPGSYCEPMYGTLIKTTFNVAIAEQCGAL